MCQLTDVVLLLVVFVVAVVVVVPVLASSLSFLRPPAKS